MSVKKKVNDFDLPFINYTFAACLKIEIKSNLLIYLHLHD